MPPSFLPCRPEAPLRQTLCTALPTSLTPVSSLPAYSSAHCRLWPRLSSGSIARSLVASHPQARWILFLSHLDTSAQQLTVLVLKSPSLLSFLPVFLCLPSEPGPLQGSGVCMPFTLRGLCALQDFQYHRVGRPSALSPAQTRLPDRQSPDSSASHGRDHSLWSSPKRLPLLCARAPPVLQLGTIQWRPSPPLPELPPTPPPCLHFCPHPGCLSHCKVVF